MHERLGTMWYTLLQGLKGTVIARTGRPLQIFGKPSSSSGEIGASHTPGSLRWDSFLRHVVHVFMGMCVANSSLYGSILVWLWGVIT